MILSTSPENTVSSPESQVDHDAPALAASPARYNGVAQLLHWLIGLAVLGQIALQNSSRLNLGLISIYRTGLGGQRLLPQLQLPRYEAVTVAAAGQFALVHRGQSPSPSP